MKHQLPLPILDYNPEEIGEDQSAIETFEGLVEYLFAGKAIFTIKSMKTGHHYTYRVNRIPNSDIFTVSYLGSDGWYYLGSIMDRIKFRKTQKTPSIVIGGRQWVAFDYFFRHLARGDIPPNVRTYHHGKCGACGRRLTDPISIKEGLGPECSRRRLRTKMGDDQ